jgi:hypothetical protein
MRCSMAAMATIEQRIWKMALSGFGVQRFIIRPPRKNIVFTRRERR